MRVPSRRLSCALVLAWTMACGGAEMKTLDVKVQTNDSELRVTNTGTTEAVGREFIIYINGTPPNAYRTHGTLPEVGGHVDLPLREFVTKNGDRFNPVAQAVTVVWIGGYGYDYRSFKLQ